MKLAVWQPSGSRVESVDVEGTNILDLEIVSEDNPVLPSAPTEPLIDPAIVSYERPQLNTVSALKQIGSDENRPSPLTDRSLEPPSQVAPISSLPLHPKAAETLEFKPAEVSPQSLVAQENIASATLTEPFNDFSLQEDTGIFVKDDTTTKRIGDSRETEVSPEAEETIPMQLPVKHTGKRTRRGARGGYKGKDFVDTRGKTVSTQPQFNLHDPATPVSRGHDEPKRPKGWRQTPLTEASSQVHPKAASQVVNTVDLINTVTRSDIPLTKRSSRNHHSKATAAQNGWATEEASDIQELGDFDFEGNLSKFDKRGVFEQIRQEDTTADEQRLVSFNRTVTKSGTNGGRNLHYSENVLDSPKANGPTQWNSGDSGNDLSETKFSSGRSSRRNISRPSLRNPPSRKGSGILNEQYPTGSGLLSDSMARTRYSSYDQAGSPKIISNPSASPFSRTTKMRPSLRLIPSDHICPCVTPLQMIELEQLVLSGLGLTEDMLLENSARAIAETARKTVGPVPGVTESGSNGGPLILILAGNTRSGARAIAAGRHLQNHQCRVVLCVLGFDREDYLLDSVRRQLVIYRNCEGLLTKPSELPKFLANLKTPTQLIIDALLGMHVSFDDLRTDDQAAYFQLASWANATKINVLSIDIASGLDPSNGMSSQFESSQILTHEGTPTIVNETDLVIRADFILSLGVPKTGLLKALGRGPAYEKWKLFVADIGINNFAWKKFGTKRRRGVEFGSEWVATVRYQAGDD